MKRYCPACGTDRLVVDEIDPWVPLDCGDVVTGTTWTGWDDTYTETNPKKDQDEPDHR